VAENHGGCDYEIADAAAVPVVDLRRVSGSGVTGRYSGEYIAAADASLLDVDDHIVRIFDLGNGTIFVVDGVGLGKDERGVLSDTVDRGQKEGLSKFL
jgi:hypothetical protein